jgi:hypothetical protein
VAIYIRNNLEFAEKYKWNDNNDSIIAIEVKCRFKSFVVACIYRAKKGTTTNFLDKLDEFLTDLGNDSILVGDFYFDLNNINATSTSMYLDLIGSYAQLANLIDHVMVTTYKYILMYPFYFLFT